jgi:hypothetical protein
VDGIDLRSFGNDLLTRLLTFSLQSVPGAVGAGLSVAGDLTLGPDSGGDGQGCLGGGPDDGSPRSVAAVGVAAELDPAQWKQASGPLWDAFRSGRIVVRPSAAADPTRPGGAFEDGGTPETDIGLSGLSGLSAEATNTVAGVVVTAGEWGGDLPVVYSLYLDRPADTKALKEIDRHEPLVTQALAFVEYCTGEEKVAQQMLQMTQYRRVIEQAKGLVMGELGSDAASAFATIARASQHFNVRLRNLCVALVEHVGDGEAEHPDDPSLAIRPSRSERDAAAHVWSALTTTTAIMPAVRGDA